MQVIKLISQVIADFASGEISQQEYQYDTELTLQQYLDKSFYKTATLIAASCKSAAAFSEVPVVVRGDSCALCSCMARCMPMSGMPRAAAWCMAVALHAMVSCRQHVVRLCLRVLGHATSGVEVRGPDNKFCACVVQVKNAMFEYGRHLGLAFQVVDDILDFTTASEQLGKPQVRRQRPYCSKITVHPSWGSYSTHLTCQPHAWAMLRMQPVLPGSPDMRACPLQGSTAIRVFGA